MKYDFSKIAATPLNLVAVKQLFTEYQLEIDSMRAHADAVQITSDKTAKYAINQASKAKKLMKLLDEKRKTIIKMPDHFVRDVNAFVRLFRKPLQEVVDIYRDKIGAYEYEQQLNEKVKAVRRTENGASAHVRTEWVFEIENESLVPNDFCSPDPKKIERAIMMGVRKIPGVKIFEKAKTILRSG